MQLSINSIKIYLSSLKLNELPIIKFNRFGYKTTIIKSKFPVSDLKYVKTYSVGFSVSASTSEAVLLERAEMARPASTSPALTYLLALRGSRIKPAKLRNKYKDRILPYLLFLIVQMIISGVSLAFQTIRVK